jgi:hypothetical protein
VRVAEEARCVVGTHEAPRLELLDLFGRGVDEAVVEDRHELLGARGRPRHLDRIRLRVRRVFLAHDALLERQWPCGIRRFVSAAGGQGECRRGGKDEEDELQAG